MIQIQHSIDHTYLLIMSFRDESCGRNVVHIFNFLNPAVNSVVVQQKYSYG